MASNLPRALQELAYEREAQAYLAYLVAEKPEHFMEGIAQANQRKVTLESFDWVRALRPGIHICNELLVQWPRQGEKKPGQVVPDNMVVISDQPLRASLSFNVPLEPAPPFWVFEYVSKGSQRKDYEDSFQKYEKELKVPYYLVFYPDTQDLTLYRHNRRKYVTVKPNGNGRYPIPPLEMEVAILDGWVRFWYQGQLVPLPDELHHELTEVRQRAESEARRADEATRRAEELQRRVEEMERELAELRRRKNGGR